MESKTASTMLTTTFLIPLSLIPLSLIPISLTPISLIPISFMTTTNEVRRQHILTRVLGITTLVILILVSIAGAAPFAYVTSIGVHTGTVFVIDTATDNLKTVVPVEGWAGEAAITPAGTKVYVTDSSEFSTNIFVIDTATNTVDAVVDVGGYPLELRLTLKDQEFM
jgi:YVTN family beta-propeller protein